MLNNPAGFLDMGRCSGYKRIHGFLNDPVFQYPAKINVQILMDDLFVADLLNEKRTCRKASTVNESFCDHFGTIITRISTPRAILVIV